MCDRAIVCVFCMAEHFICCFVAVHGSMSQTLPEIIHIFLDDDVVVTRFASIVVVEAAVLVL